MGVVAKPRKKSPPPAVRSAGRPSLWPDVLATVARSPGEWSAVGTYKNRRSASSTACKVQIKHDPRGRFEFTARTEGDKGVLYARLKTK